jgi:Big-like domain-containing protein/K319-like protein
VQADASDDVGVTKVQFFDGTTSIGTDTNGADGWSVTWNTTSVANGPHTIRATATDTANQTGTDTNNVTVDNTVDTPPTVSITSPTAGTFVHGASVAIQATATDDHGVTKVQFFDGTTSIGTDTNGADGWSVTWNTTTTGDGPHSVKATATDTTNQTGNDSVAVTVDNSAPSVSLASPAAGAVISGLTSLVATAADPEGLASVEFLVDGTTSIGTDTDGTDGWSFDWNTLGTSNGNHAVTARAKNRADLTTTSAPVTVDVENEPAPVIRDIRLADGSDDVEQRLSDGLVIATSDDLDMMVDNGVDQSTVGLRFTNVDIPAGSTITNAYVQFVADETWADPTNLTISGVAADSAPAWGSGAFSVSNAPRTTATVAWVPPGWTEPQQSVGERTANIEPVLQELVGRPGWASSNAVALVITGSGRRVAKSYEAEVLSAPVLHVEFTTPPVANAGSDKNVASHATFSLDGSGSSDPNGQPLTYDWEQIGGPVAVIDDKTKVKPVVTAPNGPATLTFRLTVTNASGKTSTDDVVVHVAAPK